LDVSGQTKIKTDVFDGCKNNENIRETDRPLKHAKN
jgi:hypothetical protein